ALSVLLRLRQVGVELPGGVVLLCPWLDLPSQHVTGGPNVVTWLAAPSDVHRCIEAYLAGHPLDDPIIDPLSADLTGLPRMLIQAASGDARLADARALYARAKEHHVDAHIRVYPV